LFAELCCCACSANQLVQCAMISTGMIILALLSCMHSLSMLFIRSAMLSCWRIPFHATAISATWFVPPVECRMSQQSAGRYPVCSKQQLLPQCTRTPSWIVTCPQIAFRLTCECFVCAAQQGPSARCTHNHQISNWITYHCIHSSCVNGSR